MSQLTRYLTKKEQRALWQDGVPQVRSTVDSQVLTQRKRLSAFASHFYRDFGYSRLKIYKRQNDQLCLVFNFVETMTSLYQLV